VRKVLGIGVAGVALLAAVASPANAAEGDIVGAGVDGAVHGSYIVVLKKGATAPAAGLAGKFGGRLGFVYSAVHGFSVEVSERQAKRLAADPSVEYVEQNRTLRVTEVQPNPPSWGLDRVDQRQLPLNSITSAWNTSDVATYTGNGTSFAAPHVAGAAALYLSANTTANPAQVSQALVSKATSGIVKNPGGVRASISGESVRVACAGITAGSNIASSR
jgi:opacity protein-like surface antigen